MKKKLVRYYNMGDSPEDFIGPVDFAGHTVVLSPKGAKYKRVNVTKEKEYKDEKTGAVEVRSYTQSVVQKVADENEDNFVDLPPGFDKHIKNGKHGLSQTPTGKFWKDIIVTHEQDLDSREAHLDKQRKQFDLYVQQKSTEVELLEARKAQLEAELAALSK